MASPSPALIQAQTAQKPLLVEVPAVGHARVKAVAVEIIHFVDVDRAGQHARQDFGGRRAGFFAQQGDHVAGVDAPVVPQHVGDLALQQKTVGEQLVARHARQSEVLDRMAERPVAQIVQQRGGNERLGVFRPNVFCKTRVVGELLQVEQRQPIHAQTMLESRVDGRRIDQRDQPQLADAGQPAEIGRVDQLPHARRQRHIDLGRNAHQTAAGVQRDDFGDVEDGGFSGFQTQASPAAQRRIDRRQQIEAVVENAASPKSRSNVARAISPPAATSGGAT